MTTDAREMRLDTTARQADGTAGRLGVFGLGENPPPSMSRFAGEDWHGAPRGIEKKKMEYDVHCVPIPDKWGVLL